MQCCPFTAVTPLPGLSTPQLLTPESFLFVKIVTRPFSVSVFSKEEEGEQRITGEKKGFNAIYTHV